MEDDFSKCAEEDKNYTKIEYRLYQLDNNGDIDDSKKDPDDKHKEIIHMTYMSILAELKE